MMNIEDKTKINIKKIFAQNVFDDKTMQKYMPKEAYAQFKKVLKDGKSISHNLAKIIAKSMCDWAIDCGATHYTHWFQPLTNTTAEKHNSFLEFNDKKEIITKLSGKALIKGESDASSFPSGGLRNTFEARGYTAWDPTSPAFIKNTENEAVLFIPTAYYSYTGEALDKKAILIRSNEVLNKETIKLLKIFNKNIKKVNSMLGAEQEYFLIDRHLYMHRKDLIYTGRTLFGALPPKSQQLFDHYYGNIRSKIASFMNDVNIELWKLGVPAKTNHNEVAPAQHELAVIYEESNIACDHNQLAMEILRKKASEYDLVCLLHEKPFDKLNGSGKHCNWSIVTDDGENLLDATNKENNLQFLLIISLIIKAVDENAEILRSSASNVGNDRRLGGTEAPPTIISIFLGDDITEIFENLSNNKQSSNKKDEIIKSGTSSIPDLYKDTTDRNRTSPFAFTGNKFEFRMVGSSDSCAMPIATINTIVANSFYDANEYFNNLKIKNKSQLQNEIIKYISNIYNEHKKIIFNGNGYSKEWYEEAKKRKLPIIEDMVSAIKLLKTDKTKNVFKKLDVMSNSELESRVYIEYETYINTINIEAKTMINIVKKQIIPSIITYKKFLSDAITSIKNTNLNISTENEQKILKQIDDNYNNIYNSTENMFNTLENLEKIDNVEEKAFEYRHKIIPIMDELRNCVDSLEMIFDRELWPMPSYGDLIFEVSPI